MKPFRKSIAFCVSLLLAAFVFAADAKPKKPISAEKARMMGYVEDYFMNNYRDVSMRKSLAWGESAKDADGNTSITYKYLASIWEKERLVIEERYTFAADGTFVKNETLSKIPAKTPPDSPADSAAVPETPETQAADAFLAEVVAERYAQARALCNATMQEAMSEKILKTIRTGLKTNYGKWNKTKPVRIDAAEEDGKTYIRVYEECTFERGTAVLMVVVDADRKIAGLFIVDAKKTKDTQGSDDTQKNGEKKEKPDADAPVKIDVRQSRLATAAGWQRFAKGEFAEAEEKFQEGIRLNPKSAPAYQGLGWVQRNLGENEEAKKSFEACIALDPKNAAALNGLGQLTAIEGDEEKAIEYWTKGLADPRASGPALGLAEIYTQRGDHEKAVEFYRKAVKAEPQNEELKAMLKNALEAAESAKK